MIRTVIPSIPQPILKILGHPEPPSSSPEKPRSPGVFFPSPSPLASPADADKTSSRRPSHICWRENCHIGYFVQRDIFAFDRTHNIYVVLQDHGFYYVNRVLIEDARSFQLWPPSFTYWHSWPRSHAGIDPMPDKIQATLLRMSKVRDYDHLCSWWSAKKTCKSQS